MVADKGFPLTYSAAMDGLEYLPTIMFSIGGVLGLTSLLASSLYDKFVGVGARHGEAVIFLVVCQI